MVRGGYQSWVVSGKVSWKPRVRTYSSTGRCVPCRCSRLVIVLGLAGGAAIAESIHLPWVVSEC
jgi:hypothetical protein